MATPDFLAIGHVVRDLQPDGWRLGGTVTFAAIQAQQLGYHPAIVTSVGPDIDLETHLTNVSIFAKPSSTTTQFENRYQGSDRQQHVLEQAATLDQQDIPAEWQSTPVVLLGPVCGELASQPLVFERSFVGVSAQGWLREVDSDRRVRRIPWSGDPFWAGCQALFVSEEDLDDHPKQVDRWVADVALVALTRAGRGARICENGAWRSIDGFPAEERDPTGAGDVFAAAFLVRYYESRQAGEAARFASAAAAFSVEGTGPDTIAPRDEIERRMTRHPDIALT